MCFSKKSVISLELFTHSSSSLKFANETGVALRLSVMITSYRWIKLFDAALLGHEREKRTANYNAVKRRKNNLIMMLLTFAV